MTIGVECPHCETTFQFDRDMIGKAVRCPNPDCREIFAVQEPTTAAPAPAPTQAAMPISGPASTPVAVPQSGSLSDFVPVFDAGPTAPVSNPVPVPAIALPEDKPLPAIPLPDPPTPASALPIGKPLVAVQELPAKSAPKVLSWDEVAEDEAPKPKPERPRRKTADEDDETPISRRKKSWVMNKVLLTFVILGLLTAVGVSVYFVLKKGVLDEKALVQQAEKQYTEGKYSEAAKTYDELITEHSGSSDRPKYEFLRKLCNVQAAISSVTTRESPGPAQQQFTDFISENGDSQFAQPDSGFGVDIVLAGQKLTSAISDHAGDRIKAFQLNRKKEEELNNAEKAVGTARTLFTSLVKFRSKDDRPPAEIAARFDSITADIQKERDRLAKLNPWRLPLEDPTDDKLARFEEAMKEAALHTDSEVLAMLDAGKKKLRELVGYTPDRVKSLDRAPEASAFAHVAPPIGSVTGTEPPANTPRETVFAIAHGLLYALDAHTGQPLWVTRTGPPLAAPKTVDLPLRHIFADGETDWSFIASPRTATGEPGITARRTRTGEIIWHQTLPKPCLGRPIVLGAHLFVPLADELGTVLQLKLSTGDQLGKIVIRQPIGCSLAVFPGSRAGHGFLVIPADARRVFVFEVGREDDDGRIMDPRAVLVLSTKHGKDTLRGDAVVVGIDDPNIPRRVILTQTDGPTSMKLRSFPLPRVAELEKAKEPQETEPKNVSEAPVNGWAWFAPASDGEKIAVTTDAGVFAVFGINQPGNSDKPLFNLPGPKPSGDADSVTRGQIVSAEDDAYWVVLGGQLTRLRTAIEPGSGPKIIPHGNPIPLGEPVARAQVRANLSLGFVTFQPRGGVGVRMLAFDLESGEIRWQRQLGLQAIRAPLPLSDGSHLLVDDGAGVYRVRRKDVNQETRLEVETITSPQVVPAGKRPLAITSADGKDLWLVLQTSTNDTRQITLRKYTDGKLIGESTSPVTDNLAGLPLVHTDRVLVPLANGFVHRYGLKPEDNAKGPLWRGGNSRADATCHLTHGGAEAFFVSDGANKVLRWSWPSAGELKQRPDAMFEVREKIAAPVAFFADEKQSLIAVPDVGGAITLFDTKKPGDVVRKWKGNAMGEIPSGKPADLMFAKVGNQVRLLFTMDRSAVVCVSTEEDEIPWVNTDKPSEDAGKFAGVQLHSGGMVLTFQSGVVQLVSLTSGKVLTQTTRETGSPTASHGGVVLSETEILLPRDDGTITLLPQVPTGEK